MRIRKFENGDAEGISAVVCRSERQTLKGYYPDDLIEIFCRERSPEKIREKSSTRDFYVAEDGGKIVGVASLEEDNVKTVFVDPDYQGMGIGKQLIEKVESLARERGVRLLHVGSTTYAEPFYRKCGFSTVKRYDDSVQGHQVRMIKMEKPLNE
jgi:N-acetylglutamate synthase-like GNAT family acetyltransferase